jgi:hypothetical protein
MLKVRRYNGEVGMPIKPFQGAHTKKLQLKNIFKLRSLTPLIKWCQADFCTTVFVIV